MPIRPRPSRFGFLAFLVLLALTSGLALTATGASTRLAFIDSVNEFIGFQPVWTDGLSKQQEGHADLSRNYILGPLATCKWTGIGGDGLWMTNTNWSGCTGGGAPASGDDVVFDHTTVAGSYVVTLNGGGVQTVRSIQLGFTGNLINIELGLSGTTTNILMLTWPRSQYLQAMERE